MKLTIVLLLTTFLQVNATVRAQNVTIKVVNVPLISVLKEIGEQTGYDFLYDFNALEKTGPISLNFSNAPLKKVLDKCFLNQYLSYSINNNTILITKEQVSKDQLTDVRITGKVTDENGRPIPGATVRIKGTQNGVTTDTGGEYSIAAPNSDAILVFSFVGYTPREMTIKNTTRLDVTLKEQPSDLNEVVVVGYGTQKKENITGAIATVNSSDLTNAPISSPANALAGRLPGLISLQSSGRPGADAANLSIRGFGNALVIVDGIETDFKTIDPNQIESISILKDASASIYGSRAGNGVILVTTKRGNDKKPTFSVNTSQTLQGITVMPRPVNSGQYTELAREAHLQAEKPEATAPFTAEQVQQYYAGNDPLFPNTNWYNELIRKWASQQQHNLSIRGGSENVKYYGFIGYLDQNTIFKTNGGDYKRYNFQSNIDAKILDNFSLQLTVASIVEDRNFPQISLESGEASAWGYFWNTLPIYPAHLPDPTKIPYADGNGTGGAHVVSNSDISGYNNTDSQNLRGSIALNYDFKFIKGLSARAFGNYSADYSSNKVFVKPVTLYNYDPTSGVYTVAGSYGSNASLTQRDDKGKVLTGQLSLNFDRTFASKHHVSALALYEVIESNNDFISAGRVNYLTTVVDQLYAGSTVGVSNNGSASEMGRVSYVGRINYAYANKYLLETILRADASAKFPAGSRWGYFPSVSAGWRIDRESFMKELSFIDNLKLRVSYGQAGNDNIGNFQYLSGYQLGTLPYLLGSGSQQAILSRGLANPYLTWEKIKTSNIGLDFSFLNRKIYGEADAFYRKRSGILASRATSVPTSFGTALPTENLNSLNDRGFEVKIGTSGSASDFRWDVSGNLSWSRAKWDHYEEPDYTDPDQIRLNKKSGNWTDRQIGYLAGGLFTSQEQINGLTYQYPNGNTSLRPGDLIILDTNDDKIIDSKDQVVIGKGTTPHWMAGFNADLKYKNFDLSALFQGALGYYTNVVFSQGKTYSTFVYDERWTTENDNPNALVPRLGGAGSNNYFTDRNYVKADYLRLKTVAIGYSLPKNLLEKINIKQVRIYLAGTNVFTLSGLNKFDLDPEAPNSQAGRYYPQQKTISIGANVSF